MASTYSPTIPTSTPLRSTAACASGLSIGLFALTRLLGTQPAQTYPEMLSSSLSSADGSKGADILTWPVSVALGVLAGVLAAGAMRRQTTPAAATALATHLLWWSLPAAAAGAALIVAPGLAVATVGLSVVGTTFIVSASWLSHHRGRPVAPASLSMSAAGAIAWGLVPLAVALASSRVTQVIGVTPLDIPWVLIALIFGVVASTSQFLVLAFRPESFDNQVWLFAGLGQVPMPLFLFAFVPARLALPDGTTATLPIASALPAILSVVISAGLAFSILRLHRTRMVRDRSLSPGEVFTPLGVLAVLLTAMFGVTRPPVISSDDYHYGETLLGLLSYQAGHLPYIGYQPAHGVLQDDLAALLGTWLYDGSAASTVEANRLAPALLASLLFAACWWTTRSLPLAVVVTWVGGGWTMHLPSNATSWTFLIAVGWIWLAPYLRRKPAWWLTCWVLTAPLVVLAVPGQGLVFVAASTLLAGSSTLSLLRTRSTRAWLPPTVAAFATLGLLVTTPLAGMLKAALSYVLRNGPVNLAAYGVSWSPRMVSDAGSPILIDLLRMTWVVGPTLCVLVAWRELRRRRFMSERLFTALFFVAFLAGMLPYVMGRIDVGVASRPGLASAFVLALVVPALCWATLSHGRRVLLAGCAVMVASGLNGTLASVERLHEASRPTVASPALVEGSPHGLPGWGRAAAEDPAHLDQVARLAELLNKRLPPGRPYYDATSRNAQYFYLGRPPVVAVSAAYNTPLIADQKRTIAQLRARKPEIAVLFEPLGNIVHDGGGLALRNPLIAAYLQSAYVPYEQDGFILGARTPLAVPADAAVTLQLAAVSDSAWDRGVQRNGSALLLGDGRAAQMLRPGGRLTFPDGAVRTVLSASGQDGVVVLDRRPPAALTSEPTPWFSVDLRDTYRDLYHAWLFERAFGNRELGKSPTAWGRSLSELAGIRMKARVTGGGTLTAQTPTLELALPAAVRRGRAADLLALRTVCTGGAGEPRLRVSWSGGVVDRPFDSAGRAFTVAGPSQLVPLDSSPFWHSAARVEKLHVALEDAAGCEGVAVSDAALYRRSAGWNSAAR